MPMTHTAAPPLEALVITLHAPIWARPLVNMPCSTLKAAASELLALHCPTPEHASYVISSTFAILRSSVWLPTVYYQQHKEGHSSRPRHRSRRSDTEKVVDDEKTAEKQRQADEEAKEAGKEGGADPVEPVFKYVPKTTVDWAVQNDNKPLWTRSPKEARSRGSDG